MILLYDNNGYIHHAVWSMEIVRFTHTTNVTLRLFEIDEIPENKATYLDVKNTLGKKDEQGRAKYSIVNNQLEVVDDWSPKPEEP